MLQFAWQNCTAASSRWRLIMLMGNESLLFEPLPHLLTNSNSNHPNAISISIAAKATWQARTRKICHRCILTETTSTTVTSISMTVPQATTVARGKTLQQMFLLSALILSSFLFACQRNLDEVSFIRDHVRPPATHFESSLHRATPTSVVFCHFHERHRFC